MPLASCPCMDTPSILLAAALSATWPSAAGAESSGRTPSPQRQQGPIEISVALLGAFGAGGQVADSAVNRYGWGIGGRAGVTLPAPRLYLGVSFIRFAGGEDASGRFRTSTLDTEVGYDFRLLDDLLVVRPELALGVARAVTIQSDNAGYPLGLHWAPGLLVGMRLPPLLVSVEIRRDLVPDGWSSATTVLLGGGAVF